MRTLCTLFMLLVVLGLSFAQPFPNGQVNPLTLGSPVRDIARINVGGFNGSGTNAQDGACIASRGQVIGAVWAEQNMTSSSLQDIWFARSLDGGLTWALPVRVDVADAPNASDADFPQIVFVDKPSPGPGQVPYNIVVAYETNISYSGGTNDDLGVAVSVDGGLTFQVATPHLQNLGAGLMGSDVDDFWLASEGSRVYLVWEEDGQTMPVCTGGNASLFFTRSLDGGLTFEPAQIVNNVVLANPADPCSNFNVEKPMVVARGDEVWISFIDNRLGTDDIWVAYSPMAGAPATWSEIQIESSTTGDVNYARIAVRPSGTLGNSMVVVTWEDNESGRYELRMSISYDSGLNWLTEIVVSTGVSSVLNSGVSADELGYHEHMVMDDGRIYLIWLDDHQASTLGQTPNNGDTPGSRQLYFASYDMTGTPIIPQSNVDPGVANQFPGFEAKGDAIIIHVERNPFGNNNLIFATSTDGGLTWGRHFVPTSTTGDVDSPGYIYRMAKKVAVDWGNFAAASIFWTNPLGRNEVYTAGVRLPYLIASNNPVSGLTTLGVAGVPRPVVPGTTFLIALGTSGIYPVTQVTTSRYVPLVIDLLTLDSLLQPAFAPFLSGVVNSNGAGTAPLGFPTPAGMLGINLAAGIVIPGSEPLFTDGYRL